MRAQVTYFNAAAAKGAHVYFLCTDTLTHDMELLFRNASMDATTGNVRHQLASPELLRRSTLSAEAAWYIRSLFAADWALVHRHCIAPGASKRGCGSETPCRAPESTRTLRCTAGCGALRSCSCFGCKTCMPLRRLPLHRLPLHRSTTSLWSGIRCCALRMHVLRPCDCTQSSASI